MTLAAISCGGELREEFNGGPNGDQPPELVTLEELQQDQDRSYTYDEPDYVVHLGDNEKLSFMVDDVDGSVGVKGEVTTGGSVLDELQLMDASPAVIFYAVSTDPVPAELLDLHERLVVDGVVEDFAIETAGLEPGWMKQVSLSGSSPCLNATFNTNHCSHPSYQDHLCKFNSSANWNWTVAEAHRYKAGFCVQGGASRSILTYNRGSNCVYLRNYYAVWGVEFPASQILYPATTYLTYVWWKPSGAMYRAFGLTGGNSSGDTFDWGQRWSRTTSCD